MIPMQEKICASQVDMVHTATNIEARVILGSILEIMHVGKPKIELYMCNDTKNIVMKTLLNYGSFGIIPLQITRDY
jgi:hypothetical protein